ncbi:MAG TPA: hypothetical protein DCQ06_01295 [Myxococcales bacterium]|nr:hypothetical protein [Myxococcales bacterium]HAN30207.1 hypothetical protein [Myxococcales bacterium]
MKPATSTGQLVYDLLIRHGHLWRRLSVSERMVLGCTSRADHRHRAWEPRHCSLRITDEGIEFCAIEGDLHFFSERRQNLLRPGQLCFVGQIPVICVARSTSRWGTMVALGPYRSACARSWSQIAEAIVFARSNLSVLIQGPSGTGKELVARIIHQSSPRSSGPFVAINCAAIAPGLIESELFGARKGAFTGAVADRKGAFQRAAGGTLFLDELGDLSASAQAALLRAIDTGQLQTVGGATTQADVRVVAATHRDLQAMVQSGNFRLDLLHRIAVCSVQTYPLKERLVDQLCLLQDWLDRNLPSGIESVLAQHHWPGNVRELKNVGHRIDCQHPFGPLSIQMFCKAIDVAQAPIDKRAWVESCIEHSRSTADAFRSSGLPRSTFFRYLKQLKDCPRAGVS